jgi:hypothetical protein
MTLQIWKVRVRDALVPRREPYWGPPLGEGKSLGLRKVSAAQSRWIAKLRNESGHHSKVLGNLTDGCDYDKARDAAAQWFKAYESGVTDDAYTVEQACKDYVEERRTEKGEECTLDADMRFKRTVYGTEFGKKAPCEIVDGRRQALATGRGADQVLAEQDYDCAPGRP